MLTPLIQLLITWQLLTMTKIVYALVIVKLQRYPIIFANLCKYAPNKILNLKSAGIRSLYNFI